MDAKTEKVIKTVTSLKRKRKSSDIVRLRKATYLKLCQIEEETEISISEIVDILICYGLEKIEKEEEEK